ncbi:MAG: nitroreductase family protein [Acidobacteria bacterium]|jgi:iodotyrosine deiodinase|nr:nitroreductase family protein [Acidobacteriota bacterium]
MAPTFQPLTTYQEYPADEMRHRAESFEEELTRRRTVRDFSSRPIPDGVLDACIRTAGTAPNGANLQPWHFVVITDPDIKRQIREAAEIEEREFYEKRAPAEWLEALAQLGTDANKPFLETAPALIAVFAESYGVKSDGNRTKNYYVSESAGIATGFLIAAVHHAGLVSLTHTPSPMGFLNGILGRPVNEKPFLLLVVGYPAADAQVPAITKRPLAKIRTLR